MHLLGIRREDKNPFERRVPLTPPHVHALGRSQQVKVTLQPSPRRIFGDEAYRQVGASITEDLSACALIMGVKEIPPDQLLPQKTYVFFSHTIKGQPYNMPLLTRLMELGCTLIDYERIVDDAGQRLVFFGRHAGLAGMIDTLWALGQRLAAEGFQTPLASLRQAHAYDSLDQAKAQIRQAGTRLETEGLPDALTPLVFGFTGYGNVSLGAQEICDLLAPHPLEPEDLVSQALGDHALYKVVFHERHMVQSHSGAFDLQDYYQRPEGYRSTFGQYLPRLSVLVNGIYWDARYPRLVTLEQLRDLFSTSTQRLRVIGDISCDVQGSIEATLHPTEPDNPVFVYDISSGRAIDGVDGNGPVIMAVDNLPAELPRESSAFFSEALSPFIPALVAADYSSPFERCQLPDPIRRAVIVYRGALTEPYAYLSQYI